ncbi:MAG: OmpA family protein [Prolixibacteraceae bacterium]|jgi:outer membrane protein OmpA-like peptidoglycan-associated protein
MKKVLLLSLILSFAFLSNAQTSDKKWGLGLGVGAYGTTNIPGTGFMPELYLSRYLSPRFDLMLKGDMGLWRSDLITDLDLFNPSLDLRFKLSDESKKLRPYLYAGPGLLSDNSEKGLNFNLGVGAKYYISSGTALYLDAGYINGVETTREAKAVRDNFWKATLGIEFDFGKAKDSDMDGVSDNKDKCPDTPAGVAVDDNGCPVDTDGDGVADYVDDCPTVPGLTSLKGCPDSDKDGIADKDDDCPDVAGLASLKGCPDTDGDGVADKDDKCPDTPKGWKVDASGCPSDQDKDGLFDEEDDCPTVAGPKENKGCPVKELTAEEIEAQKMKVEPVYFDFNKANYLKSEKAKIDKLVTLLKENSNYKVNISGYTDDKGTDSYNKNLSGNRISSVVRAVRAEGIKKARIATQKPMGEANPAATNDTDEGRALNRRVEFEVFKTN